MSTDEVAEKNEDQVLEIVEPTYQLKPDESESFPYLLFVACFLLNHPIRVLTLFVYTDERFYPSKAKLVAEEILKEELEGKIDEKWIEEWQDFGDEFEALSKDIADKIKEKCKTSLNMPRYKIIVQVTIGQMKEQGVKLTSRCLWDTATDNYATVSFQNQHVWASAIAFGLYTD